MQFLMIYTPDDDTPPGPEKLAELQKFGEDAAKSGVLVATGGIFPSAFKLAKVIPIFKKNDRHIPSNYRPIAIFSNVS